MSQTPAEPDERLIYACCRSIFSGEDAQIRDDQSIAEVMYDCEGHIIMVIQSYGLESVVRVARRLLEQRVFEDTELAMAKFPEYFTVVTGRSGEARIEEVKSLSTNPWSQENWEAEPLLDDESCDMGEREGDFGPLASAAPEVMSQGESWNHRRERKALWLT